MTSTVPQDELDAEAATTAEALGERVARRFEPRVALDQRGELARMATELTALHPDEGTEELSARLVARAAARLGVPLVTAPSLCRELPLTRLERRLAFGDELLPFAPSEVGGDGRPSFEDPVPLGHADVIGWWRELFARRADNRAPRAIHFYTHVPFCRTRCDFCQCDSVVSSGRHEVDAYVREVEEQADAFARDLGTLTVETATIGGGTPSHLDEPDLARVLAALVGRTFQLVPGGYFSAELNPDSTTADKLRLLADAGVNRVSFGVQSFHRPTLQNVRRGYQTADMTRDALTLGHAVPDLQLALDLIAPLPLETPESFACGLREAFELEPHEIVLYRYQPVERRGHLVDAPRLSWEAARDAFLEEIERRGYRHLSHAGPSIVARHREARNFAVRYNQHTIEPSSMLGLGPFAESRVYGIGLYKSRGTGESGPSYVGVTTSLASTRDAFVRQHLLAGTPIDHATFRRTFGDAVGRAYAPELAYLEELGVVAREAGRVGFTPRRAELAARCAWLFVDGETRSRVRARARARAGSIVTAGEAAAWLRSVGCDAAPGGNGSSTLLDVHADVSVGPGGPIRWRLGGLLDLDLLLDGPDEEMLVRAMERFLPAGREGEATATMVRVLARLSACRALRELSARTVHVAGESPSVEYAAAFAAPSGPAIDALLGAARVDPVRLPGSLARDHARTVTLRVDPAGEARLALRWRVDASRSPQWRRLQRTAPAPLLDLLRRGGRIDIERPLGPEGADVDALLVRELPAGGPGTRLADLPGFANGLPPHAARLADARVSGVNVPCPRGAPDPAAAIVLASSEPHRARAKRVSLLATQAAGSRDA
jgi:coproporphyrinogen III oxidase-like Fe-S oxidoreductase